jgi:hypothetical protein
MKENLNAESFENRVSRKVFGFTMAELAVGFKDCITRSFIIHTLHQILLA